MRFSEILFIATAVTGLVWLIDRIWFRPKRMMYVLADPKRPIKEPWWIEYSKSFFPVLLIVFLLRTFIAEPFRIPSGSMRPTLLEGDFIVVNKFDYGLRLPILDYKILAIGQPKRGDIVIFKHVKNGESLDMVKRVVGLPGDHIQYQDKTLYINGKPMLQTFEGEKIETNAHGMQYPVREFIEDINGNKHQIFVRPDVADNLYYYKYKDIVVPPDHYFMLGDNRDGSDDSRFWGFVSDKDLQGRAIAIWMSWGGFKHPVRWNRLKFLH